MRRTSSWRIWDDLQPPDGQFRETAFALHAMLRPQLWGKLMQLAGNSEQALKALTQALARTN